jgi:5'-nucleotidase
LEVLTSIYPLKGSDYFLQISGLKFTYNPNRVIFDRVTEILMENEKGQYQPLDYSSSNKTLYRVAANIYNATFLKIIGSYTMNILTIVPKDKNGAPIDDLAKAIVDGDREKAGVQELKEWLGMMLFVKGFPDIDGNGTPDVPEAYREKQGRIVMAASWNPVSLLSRGTWITWTVFGVLMLVFSLTATIIVKVIKMARRRTHHA